RLVDLAHSALPERADDHEASGAELLALVTAVRRWVRRGHRRAPPLRQRRRGRGSNLTLIRPCETGQCTCFSATYLILYNRDSASTVRRPDMDTPNIPGTLATVGSRRNEDIALD